MLGLGRLNLFWTERTDEVRKLSRRTVWYKKQSKNSMKKQTKNSGKKLRTRTSMEKL